MTDRKFPWTFALAFLVLVVAFFLTPGCASQPPLSFVDARTFVNGVGSAEIAGGLANGAAGAKSTSANEQNPSTSANVPVDVSLIPKSGAGKPNGANPSPSLPPMPNATGGGTAPENSR